MSLITDDVLEHVGKRARLSEEEKLVEAKKIYNNFWGTIITS